MRYSRMADSPRRNANPGVLAQIAGKGPHQFSAPPPEEAFEKWWRKEFGSRMKGSKDIGRRAWYAGLREMGL